MCGRFAAAWAGPELRRAVEEDEGFVCDRALDARSRAQEIDEFDGENEEEGGRYNVAPNTGNAVMRTAVMRIRGGAASADRVRINRLKWGLQPHYLKEPPTYATALKTINARDDTVMSGSGLWAGIRGSKRGVLHVSGFYEWLNRGKDKIPHYVKRKDVDGKPRLMALAVLWDSVTYDGEEPTETFSIVTTSSNKQLQFLHSRMPVILPDHDAIATWLDTSSGEWTKEHAALLKPFADPNGLECYAVTPEVGKVGNNSADFVIKKGSLNAFFAKQASPKKAGSSSKGSSQDDPPAPSSSAPSSSKASGSGAKAKKSAGATKRQAIELDSSDGDEPPTASAADETSNARKKLRKELNPA